MDLQLLKVYCMQLSNDFISHMELTRYNFTVVIWVIFVSKYLVQKHLVDAMWRQPKEVVAGE
jgi:hypothetical protein